MCYMHKMISIFLLLFKSLFRTSDDLYWQKTKKLVQDLLLEIFENPGTAFIEEEEFASIAKNYLATSHAVLKNALAIDEDAYIASF